MPIRVKCGNCKKTLSVKDHLAGKKIKCPVCQGVVVVSAAPPAKTPPDGSTPKAPAAKSPAKKPVPTSKPAPNGKKPAVRAPAPAPEPKAPEPPAPPSEEVEAEAAALFGDEPPPVVDENPKTIDFKCEWCDVELHFPIDMGGKRTQCTNEDCRRLIKVPMPTVQAKKDWRKMDRQGPAAARVNQPEELENAWGTENTTRARQDSLAKAGAIDAPPKPKLGFVGIMGRVLVFSSIFAAIGGIGFGGVTLYYGKQQNQSIKDAQKLVFDKPPKIVEPVLAAEVHRTIGLMYMQKGDHGLRKPAEKVQENFHGARMLAAPPGKEQSVHEQMFLLELALTQIELGADANADDVVFAKTRQSWDTVRKDLLGTLDAIENPDAKAMALREVITRLLQKKDIEEIADGLAGSLKIAPQHIALRMKRGKEETIKEIVDPKDHAVLKELLDKKDVAEMSNTLRTGFAEGHARKGEFDEAAKFTSKGLPKDRLEACIGVAAIALSMGKTEEAKKFVTEGRGLLTQGIKDPWTLLFLARLAARTADTDETLKEVSELVPAGPLRLRTQLEVVQVKCDKATAPIAFDVLADLEGADAKAAEAKEATPLARTTLALGWNVVAQQHSRRGKKSADILKAFSRHADGLQLSGVDKLLPLAEIGAFHGSIK